MLINEGIGDKPTSVYKDLINLKFFFSILCLLLLLIIWLTYDNNIYSGLSMIAEYNDKNYKIAFIRILSCLIIFSFCLGVDLIIQITGLTYNFYKLNALNLSLKIFEVFLLSLFFLDSWHYITLFYILAFTQLICSIFEVYAIIFSLCSTFKKYQKIRNFEVKSKY
jgi:hypothetical protein